MAFSPQYIASQIIGSPSVIKFIDSSTGSDVAITQRRIYLTDYANNPVVPEGATLPYMEWALVDATYLADVLNNTSKAINIVVQWLDVNDNLLYATPLRLQGFSLFAESFYFSLTQMQAMQNNPPPNIVSDSNYYMNKGVLRTELDSALNAVTIGGDIVCAQKCYERADYLVNNQQKFF
jgi:hypothetical protein